MTTLTGSTRHGTARERRLLGLGPAGLRRLLNALCVGLVVATLAGWGDPDLVLDALWVTLAVGSFVFGLRTTVLRILVVTLIVVAASALEWVLYGQPALEVLDAEWPLMAGLSILIAVMADRVSTTARRYGTLYRQASDRLVTAQEDERDSLARDLHDGVGQTLTAVVLTLDAGAAALSAGPDAGSAEAAIRRARALAVAALDEARSVAARLRPARIHEVGLGAAVRDLAESAGVPVDVRFAPSILPPGLVEPEREIDAYRIVQEALGNAARHSNATHVWVDAEVRDGEIWVQVGDDGVGFDGRMAPVGMGLAGMKERAAILRGRLDVRSQPGAGTTVDLLIPVIAPSASIDLAGATANVESAEPRPVRVGLRPEVGDSPVDGRLTRASPRPQPGAPELVRAEPLEKP
jgi:two-component system, NarL family, sensor histidine kinase UhpB